MATATVVQTVVQGQGKEAGSEEVGEDKVAASLVALLREPKGHSPIIGYAFDGFPIYGPVGWDAEGRPTLMTSSYDPTTKQYVQVGASHSRTSRGQAGDQACSG
jgi:hypothetical protein